MEDKHIIIYPHKKFEEECERMALTDANVEQSEYAFIDIIGNYRDEDEKHWFNENHSNVINLDFDDISVDEIEYEGHTLNGISIDQAQQLFDFIESNINRTFYICCIAGMSRSQGVGAFIKDFYPFEFQSDTLLPHPNKDVYRKLSRCYYKKYLPHYK